MGEDGDKEEKAVRSIFQRKKPECPILWEFDGAVKFSKFAPTRRRFPPPLRRSRRTLRPPPRRRRTRVPLRTLGMWWSRWSRHPQTTRGWVDLTQKKLDFFGKRRGFCFYVSALACGIAQRGKNHWPGGPDNNCKNWRRLRRSRCFPFSRFPYAEYE